MGSLDYVGVNETATPTNVVSNGQAVTAFDNAPLSKAAVASQVAAAAATYVSLADLQNLTAATNANALPPTASYYQQQLLDSDGTTKYVPTTWGGADSVPASTGATPTPATVGVATLDSSGHIVGSQLPAFGGGWWLGPFGATDLSAVLATATPVRFADWDIGNVSPHFLPWAFATVLVTTQNAWTQPIVELRMSSTQTTYAGSTLIARGVGRQNLIGTQGVTVKPVPTGTGQAINNTGLPWSTLWVSAWAYEPNGQPVSIDGNSGLMGSAIYLIEGSPTAP